MDPKWTRVYLFMKQNYIRKREAKPIQLSYCRIPRVRIRKSVVSEDRKVNPSSKLNLNHGWMVGQAVDILSLIASDQ